MSKNYVSKVLAIDCFGNAIIELPDELFDELDWRVGDELDYDVKKDKSVIVKNLTKEKRNATNK